MSRQRPCPCPNVLNSKGAMTQLWQMLGKWRGTLMGSKFIKNSSFMIERKSTLGILPHSEYSNTSASATFKRASRQSHDLSLFDLAILGGQPGLCGWSTACISLAGACHTGLRGG